MSVVKNVGRALMMSAILSSPAFAQAPMAPMVPKVPMVPMVPMVPEVPEVPIVPQVQCARAARAWIRALRVRSRLEALRGAAA